jgi:hypothetical protein
MNTSKTVTDLRCHADAGSRFAIVGAARQDMNVTVQQGSSAETPFQMRGLKSSLCRR